MAIKKPKTEQVKDFLVSANLDDYASVQEIINGFCEQSGETITYSQFHQIYKQFIANPEAFKRAMEVQKTMGGTTAVDEIEEEIVTVKMKDVKLDPVLFQPIKTGKGIDVILSDAGGVLRGCVIMVIGDPGAGKSTITADILADLEKASTLPAAVPAKKGKKVEVEPIKTLYIQGEQSVIDAGYYYNKTPRTGNIENLFLSQYANPCKALEKVLKQGWDVVVLDSFNDVLLKIQAATGMSSKQVEQYLINLLVKTAEGNNDLKKYTTFFCIQQVTKGGEFVGTNVIKHATTAMMEVRYDETNKDERYVEFTKNRRCGDATYKRMYFSLDKQNGEIVYDLERYKTETSIVAKAAVESARNAQTEEDFKKVFFGSKARGTGKNVTIDEDEINA